MRYMLTLFSTEGGSEGASPEEMKAALGRWSAFDRELVEAGAYIAGDALQLGESATTVRFDEGDERPITDGPFAETKEQLGGFYLLECANLDEALEWAKRVPLSDRGVAVEVRPVMDLSPFGYEPPKPRGEVTSQMDPSAQAQAS